MKHSLMNNFIRSQICSYIPQANMGSIDCLVNVSEDFLYDYISFNDAAIIFNEMNCSTIFLSRLSFIKSDELFKKGSRKKAILWTNDEDSKLIAAVNKFGMHDWRVIASYVGTGRTSSQCNQRWTRALNPSIIRTPWTEEEDEKIMMLVSQYGDVGWRKIASQIPGRTDLQCRHRYIQIKKHSQCRNNSSNVSFLINDTNQKMNSYNINDSLIHHNHPNNNSSISTQHFPSNQIINTSVYLPEIDMNYEFKSSAHQEKVKFLDAVSRNSFPELTSLDNAQFFRLPPLVSLDKYLKK
ncbi:Myb-like DNA-binding domain containing protein [Tritrichomonas foetus]|uniref:Myb-like DNA-binding domain containing protein n=1 Tax=Tritrichomonas foetus TaxID=1144522 RepID=A0A1J4JQ29_9EUKA|nr:Myb-like DNA-binding domain containing protein [Tritrichomonas foetus]|eukprot:OHT01155.1 Myb-like DNA-binding domain containing protein [Tritrichomonas foetus]